MKLIATGFSANSKLNGTLILADDAGDPLGWEESGDWSSPRFQRESLAQMVALVPDISEDRARSLISRALADARRQAGIPAPGTSLPAHDFPTILTSGRQPRDIEAAAWDVLRHANEPRPEFFSFGNLISHLERDKGGGLFLQQLTLAGLRGQLKKLADFVVLAGPDERPAVAPRTMLEDMLAVAVPPLPAIVAISQTPVLVPPGHILDTEGYHDGSGLYLLLDGEKSGVSFDMPYARRLLLDDLLVDFPFASAADQANAVAAFLTPIVRPYIAGPTPLFLVEAPTEGSGKGLLCDVISQVITKGYIPKMTEGKDEEEWRKRITSTLKPAPNLVCIDNVLRLESQALSAALTASIWSDREIRYTRNVVVPVRCTWLASGNNPSLSREIARRTVRIRITPLEPIPWERTGFHVDLEHGWALSHRGDLLRSLLVFVQAWLAAGKPRGQVTMGSFQEWADVLGGILSVAGIGGFLGNRGEVYSLAGQAEDAWEAFAEAWWQTWKEDRVTAEQLLDLARVKKMLKDVWAGRGELGASQAFGKAVMSRRDRRHGRWIVRWAGAAHGSQQYRLEHVKNETPSPVELKGSKNPQNQPNQPFPEAEGGGFGGFGGFYPP